MTIKREPKRAKIPAKPAKNLLLTSGRVSERVSTKDEEPQVLTHCLLVVIAAF